MPVQVNKFYYFPLKILLTFLVFTCLLFAFGPIMWPIPNPLVTFGYLAIVHLALFLGYRHGVQTYKIRKRKTKISIKPEKLFTITAISYLIWAIPTLLDRWKIGSLSPSSIISKVSEGLNTPQLGYMEKMESIGMERSFFSYINFFVIGITCMAIPLAAAYWSKLNITQKLLAFAVVFIEIIIWIGLGTNKGVFDVFLIISFIAIAGNWESVYRNRKKITFYSLIFMVLVIFYFINNIFGRVGIIASESSLSDIQIMFTGNRDIGIDPNNFMIKYFSPLMQSAIATIEGYSTIGYYCFSLALDQPSYDWTYGFGNSWAGIDLFKLFAGQDLLPLTYISKLDTQYGIDPGVAWHTIYTWLANDITFYLVPFVIFIIAKYFAAAWLDTLNRNSVFAPVICSLFVLMVFYFFANNQVLSFSFIPFWLSFFLWRITR